MAYIYIVPDYIKIRKLKLILHGKFEIPEDIHCTVLHICEEELDTLDNFEKQEKIVKSIAKDLAPFTIDIDSVDQFDSKEYFVHYLKVNKSKELSKLNSSIKKAFDKEDLDYSKTYNNYNPHFTLEYSQYSVDSFDIDKTEIKINKLYFECSGKIKEYKLEGQ